MTFPRPRGQLLAETSDLGAALLQAVPATVFLLNHEGIYLDFHLHPEYPSAVDPEKFIGKRISTVMPGAIGTLYAEHFEALIASGENQIFTHSAHFGGQTYYREGRMTNCGSDHVLLVVQDKTQVIKTEKARRDTLELYEFIVEAAEEGIMMINATNTVTFANPKMHKLLDYAAGEMIGVELFSLFPESEHAKVLARQADRRAGISSQYEVMYLTKKGTRVWALLSVLPLKDEHGTYAGALGMHADITHLKAQEIERAKMLHNSKMSSLGEMAAGIAHEINNPLAIIHSWAAILSDNIKSGSPDPDLIGKAALRIESTVLRISKIIKSLRAFARDGDRDPFQNTRVKALLEDTAEFCAARFKHHEVAFTIESFSEQLMLECRPIQISQVLLNLLNNAFDAVAELEEKSIRIITRDLGDFIELRVVDSGQGIASALQDKILQPFFTTKEAGKGTGLGLSVSKGIIDDHRGTLTIGKEGPNTAFIVTLPKTQ